MPRKGGHHTSEARAKRLGIKRPPFSAEWLANMATANKASISAQTHLAEMSALNRGRKRSSETKAKIAAGTLGREHSLETRAKMSYSQKNSPKAQAHRARIGRISPTSIEVQLRNALDAAGVDFVFQFPVPGTPYVADFYLPRKNTILEADGEYWHSRRPGAQLEDAKRDTILTALGYQVVRLGEEQIRAGTEDLCKTAFL